MAGQDLTCETPERLTRLLSPRYRVASPASSDRGLGYARARGLEAKGASRAGPQITAWYSLGSPPTIPTFPGTLSLSCSRQVAPRMHFPPSLPGQTRQVYTAGLLDRHLTVLLTCSSPTVSGPDWHEAHLLNWASPLPCARGWGAVVGSTGCRLRQSGVLWLAPRLTSRKCPGFSMPRFPRLKAGDYTCPPGL